MSHRSVRVGLVFAIMLAMLAPSCSSLTWTGTHDGIRYSIHRDKRTHAIVKGEDGSLMYDSPELVVHYEAGRLIINGEECGVVSEGDHVEVTGIGTVLVNGQRRGDKLTGHAAMQKRLQEAKSMQTHSEAELDYKANNG
ncbi:hypothetical protein [Thalassoglobus polymorphus]|uniref:Lipoprotein n=1 Tax=Thalassoglobus polymorphus TaxID=2527994 RepID=A0A517QPA0_9PLAN|nr:hypothetical protein [Thalassoglobus polymorphus]QDT33456.1 hypothetical protein Mal48_27090 [Thalassoglobus polymorphus]